MPHLHRMADNMAFELMRQQTQEGREIIRRESLGGRQLPQDRSELRLELQDATAEEALDRRSGFGEHGTMGREARPLEREDEIVRRLFGPAPKALGLLAAVERAADLDRGERPARVLKLTRLRQSGRVERAAPGLEHPAADADPDHAPANRAAICILGPRGRSPGPGP